MASVPNVLAAVAEITKRPDARARSLLALNTLITEIITNADYAQDLVETTLDNPATDSVYAAIPLPTGLRKIAYVTCHDRPLTRISARQALDAKGCQLVDVFYQSGRNLIVHGTYEFSTVRIGYYKLNDPLQDTELDTNTHWLLEDYPDLVINGTVGRTFAATGDDTSATYYERIYLQLRSQIRRQDLGEE